jgi:hypothetical protein
MRRWGILTTLVALLALPVAPAKAASGPDFVAFNARGTSPVTHHADGSFGFTVDLFSLTTGQRIGSLTDRARCAVPSVPPCTVLEIITTYRLPGGEVVSRAKWSVMPDPGRPGFVLAGSGTRGTQGTTVLRATGAYRGRTGRVSGWGGADMRGFPARIGIDIFGLLRFDPRDGAVIGSSELFADDPASSPEASRIVSQYFLGDGANRSQSSREIRVTTPLYSLHDGERHALADDTATCARGPSPCLVYDVLTTFEFSDGTVKARSRIPITHDPQRPGFGLFGARPETDTILWGTGAYAGRTGRLLVSGNIDLRSYPVRMPVEGISVLVFD